FVSFDGGDNWQSLQLNLPPASMRDLAVHGDDLIVATHGRGFWVLDDIGVLRQITNDITTTDAFLFRPAEAVSLPPSTDNRTPAQKDEPQAETPPTGAIIDYYLKAAAGPVTIEILDARGQQVRLFASNDRPAPVSLDTLAVNAVWTEPPEPPSASGG